MKAQMLYNYRNMREVELPVPKPKDDEVLIKVKAAGICGSDIHTYNTHFPVNVNIVIGHEFSGTIEKMGKTAQEQSRLKVGDRVFGNPIQVCGNCINCRKGWFNLCENDKIISAFAEYLVIRYTNLYKLEDRLSFEEGALIEPLACALNGVNNLEVQLGDDVVVIGSGSIGMLMLQLIRARGAGKIAMAGINDWQLKFAENSGADRVFNTADKASYCYTADIAASISEWTNGRLADKVIVVAADPAALNEAQYLTGANGTIVYFTDSGKNILVPSGLSLTTARKIRFAWLGSTVFPQALKIANSGLIDLKKIITHRFCLDKLGEAMEFMSSDYPQKIKGIVIVDKD